MYTPLLIFIHTLHTILLYLYNIIGTDVLKLKGVINMRRQYIAEINEQLEKCNDVALLDLILTLLNKSIK